MFSCHEKLKSGPVHKRNSLKIPKRDATRIAEAISLLEEGLLGDIKKLTNHTPSYRLRVGDWRVLFDVFPKLIVIQTIKHRREAY